MQTVRDEALKIVKSLPDEATWDDLMYSLYVRQAIEEGLRASEAGTIIPVEELRARLGLPQRKDRPFQAGE